MQQTSNTSLLALTLGAVGVVYGDVGTSVLYPSMVSITASAETWQSAEYLADATGLMRPAWQWRSLRR